MRQDPSCVNPLEPGLHGIHLLRRSSVFCMTSDVCDSKVAHLDAQAVCNTTSDASPPCKQGLYARYSNDPREALRQFNMSRKDSKWGTPSLLHMVEVGEP